MDVSQLPTSRLAAAYDRAVRAVGQVEGEVEDGPAFRTAMQAELEREVDAHLAATP